MSNKTIAVIAANGRSGAVFVQEALRSGYHVRAGVYGGASLAPHKNLTVVTCNALVRGDVDRLLTGANVVVSLIGHTKNSPEFLQTETITHVLHSMQAQGIKRLISLTGTGVRFGEDTPNIVDRLANVAIKLIDPKRVKDGVVHADVLKNSQLDWTIVRVLKLTNGSHRGTVQFSLNGPAESFTPRARVAAAILQLIKDESYIRQAPIIIGTKGK
ncbi:MAG TPA: NAD(P)H-binding protein [Patescibacteria group bacterium]|nr:NAD(P)H-binding protein [Patescibacteria group bacterium]